MRPWSHKVNLYLSTFLNGSVLNKNRNMNCKQQNFLLLLSDAKISKNIPQQFIIGHLAGYLP